jgi:hypothetical protein
MVAHGAGVESRDHGYESCEVEHQDMPNIHAVSASYASLRAHCQGASHRLAPHTSGSGAPRPPPPY